MPTNLTPLDSFDELIAVPDEGEEVVAALVGAGKGPVRPGFQANANRDAALHALSMNTSLVPRVSLSATGAEALRISIPGRVAGIDSNGKRWMLSGTPGFNIGPDSQVGAPATWPANTWMYLYCYATTLGQMGIETSTTAPASGLVFKTGDTTRRYMGAFLTGGGGSPGLVGFRSAGGRIVLDNLVQVATGAPADFVAGLTSLAAYLPPHVRLVRLHLAQVTDNTGSRTLYIQRGGATITLWQTITAPQPGAGSYNITGNVELALNDSQQLAYRVAGGGVGNGTVYLAGFDELAAL